MTQPKERSGGDSYWRLNSFPGISNDLLQGLAEYYDYYHLKNARKSDLLEVLHRAERELVNYRICTHEELHKFAVDRRLVPPTSKKKMHKQLVKLLEEADKNATFSRFLDLPAELRCRVYDQYMTFRQPLEQPSQPPVTRASRLLRQEALPIFYKKCHFLLDLRQTTIYGKDAFKFEPKSLTFLQSLTKVNLGNIRKLQLVFTVRRHISCDRYLIDLDLDAKYMAPVTAAKVLDMNWREVGEDERLGVFKDSLLNFFQSKGEEKKKLSIEDVYLMRRNLEDAVFSD